MECTETNGTFYVTDYLGNLAGHDLDFAHAKAVLEKQIELDPGNSREWEILKESESV